MKQLLQSVMFAAATMGLVCGVAADDKKIWTADASRGQLIAEKLCVSCHLIESGQSKSVVAGVPSFQAMAKLPNKRITGMLINPHVPMPNMNLTRNEIADIIAYVTELRRKAAGKPPSDRTPKVKPTYPSPS